MLFKQFAISHLVVCLLVLTLIFSVAGCISKKHVANENAPSAVTSGSEATQSGFPAISPSSGQSADVSPQSGLLGAAPNRSGSADTSQQSGQNVITYGAYALWTGKWDTTFFKYGGQLHKAIWDLKQVESSVTGTYDWDNGRLNCKQSKTSGLMIGSWAEAPTYRAPDDAGDIELQQSTDGNSFTGKWRYGNSGGWVGEWNGKRIR
jgi:hypothetical protein